jgi:hypothetical protein
MPLPNPYPTIQRDGRIYLAPTSSVPMVYPFAVDEAAKEVSFIDPYHNAFLTHDLAPRRVKTGCALH